MRLNGWRRVGIILSGLAAIAAWVFIANQTHHSVQDDFDFWLNRCTGAGKQFTQCWEYAKTKNATDAAELRGQFWQFMGLAAAAIALLWVVTELAVKTARWVRRGFQQ